MKVITDGTISIGALDSDTQRPKLCVIEGNSIAEYATFRSQDAAAEFLTILAKFVNATPETN